MTSKAIPALAALLLAAPASSAFAAPSPLPPSAPAEPADVAERERPVWYGYKLMLADAASLALVVGGVATDMAPLAVTGLGGVLLGAPIVHGAEGQSGRALGSLGMRVVLPLAGGALAVWAYDRNNRDSGTCDCMGGMFAYFGGVALGMGVAMMVDAAFLGWRSEPVAARRESLSLLPSFGLAPGGGSVGLAGRF
jgi:hypothetical protein